MRANLGSYPATIRDVHDPMRSGRVRVSCPPLYGQDLSPWCLPQFAANLWSVPLEGTTVWITLRHGDVRHPIWQGGYTTYNPASMPEEFHALNEGPYKDELRDAKDHTSAYDVSDHKKGHDHDSGEYWNPYWHGLRFPMGSGLGVNEEPGEQGLRLHDRIGQYLEMRGDPLAPKDPHDETRVGGEFDAPDLDDANTLFDEEGYKARTTLRARHEQKLEFRLYAEEGEEEMILESLNLAADEGSRLSFSNSLLDAGFLLERVAGSNHQKHEARVDPNDLTTHFQTLYDDQGQYLRINSDPNTPLRYLELANTPGESFRIDHDLKKITIRDRLGNQVLFDVNADEMIVEHHSGETVKLSSSGMELTSPAGVTINTDAQVAINSAAAVSVSNGAPMTVNGRAVVLHGDLVNTPMGPGSAVGSGI